MSWPQTNYKQSTELGLIHGVHQSPTQTTFSHTQLFSQTPVYFISSLFSFSPTFLFPALKRTLNSDVDNSLYLAKTIQDIYT